MVVGLVLLAVCGGVVVLVEAWFAAVLVKLAMVAGRGLG